VSQLRANAAARPIPEGFVMIGNDKVKVCPPQAYIEGPIHEDSTQRVFYVDDDIKLKINHIDEQGLAEVFIAYLMQQGKPFKLYHYSDDKLRILVTYNGHIIDQMISDGSLATVVEVNNELV
jgi:hypothetical protein